MHTANPNLLSSVLKLPVEDRINLMGQLRDSLHGIPSPEFDQACIALSKRREALLRADPSRRRTLEQVLESVSKKAAR